MRVLIFSVVAASRRAIVLGGRWACI